MKADGGHFVAAFESLKAATDDDPETLLARWQEDADLCTLCDGLVARVHQFELVESLSKHPMTANVPASAVRARREFDERWIDAVRYVSGREFHDLLTGLLSDDEVDKAGGLDELAIKIGSWKAHAKEDAGKLQELPWFAEQQRGDDEHDNFGFLDGAIEAWQRLLRTGFDAHGVFWRRRAVPHVLVPAHVASHYGATRASLYRRYIQSAQAFVFGAPLAALALQRATLEEALHKHWGAEGGIIRNANLPDLAWDARASRLKRMANDALHNDPEREGADALDRAIIENFHLLRLIIENAPSSPPTRNNA